MSVGCLYAGTSLGYLLQFSVQETLSSLSLDFMTKVLIIPDSKVTFVHAAPTINRMLVMCDSTLHILNMSDLAILPMAGSNKLKGLSAACVNSNPTSENPFSIEVKIKVITKLKDVYVDIYFGRSVLQRRNSVNWLSSCSLRTKCQFGKHETVQGPLSPWPWTGSPSALP